MRSEQEAAPGAAAIEPRARRKNPDGTPQVSTRPPRPTPPLMDGAPRIVVARSLNELTEHRQALDDLAADSLETNVFYESILAEAAVRSFGAGRQHQLLVEQLHARRRPFWLGDWSTRAFFEPGVDGESYLRGAISGLALKEVRRKEKRLRERGRLVWRELEPGEDAAPWLRDFLELEASGWKGRGQSALACSQSEREFFVSAATAAHDLGQLTLLGLFLDDRPLALKCNFLAGAGGFAFKIAFGQEYPAF